MTLNSFCCIPCVRVLCFPGDDLVQPSDVTLLEATVYTWQRPIHKQQRKFQRQRHVTAWLTGALFVFVKVVGYCVGVVRLG